MRLYQKEKIQLSEDLLTDPKLIRFSEDFEETDITNLNESVSRIEAFPAGSIAIPLGNISQAQFLYIRPKADVQITLDAGSPITIKGGKATQMWAKFSAFTLTIPAQIPPAPVGVSLLIAGA